MALKREIQEGRTQERALGQIKRTPRLLVSQALDLEGSLVFGEIPEIHERKDLGNNRTNHLLRLSIPQHKSGTQGLMALDDLTKTLLQKPEALLGKRER